MQTLRYNYRLKPTPEQEEKLIEFSSYARGVWNLMLSENERRYRYDKTFVFKHAMHNLLKELKPFPEFAWLKSFDAASAQMVCAQLDEALNRSFAKISNFPRFKDSYKRKKLLNDSFPVRNTNESVRIEDDCIRLPKIGFIPVVLHRKLVSAIKTATVRFKHGKWYISIVQEAPTQPIKQHPNSAIGCDINSNDLVVDSNGKTYENPKFLKRSKTKLKQLQRQLARRNKGSKRWQHTKERINKLHGLISRQRHDNNHKIAHTIAKSADIVICEDLNVKAMQKFNGQMVADNAMGGITGLIKYKTHREGGFYHEIGRFEKSTGICYTCEHPHTLTLKQRQFECERCKTFNLRDVSAAITIKNKGLIECIASGSVAWVNPAAQQKPLIKTKVSDNSEFSGGTEKTLAA